MFTEHHLWRVSTYSIEMSDYDGIKDQLKSFVYDYDKSMKRPQYGDSISHGIGPHKQRHKHNLSESYPDLFEQDNQAIQQLREFCGSSLMKVVTKLNSAYVDTDNLGVGFVDSWYHITKDRGYHDYHLHGETSWCGIFYVDIGDADVYNSNGVNRFYSPFTVPPLKGLEYISMTTHDMVPKNGKLIIFPGFLAHSALPYYGDKDRIVISFNADIGQVPDD